MNTFDIYEGGRRIIANAAPEDVVRALWARWHARQGTFAGEAFEIPEGLRFEVDGLTVVERETSAPGPAKRRTGVRRVKKTEP